MKKNIIDNFITIILFVTTFRINIYNILFILNYLFACCYTKVIVIYNVVNFVEL